MTDPYANNVVLLLHMDGADSGTTFTDSSTVANVMVASGLAKTATAAAKFGTTGGQFSSAVQVGAAYARTPVTVGGPLDLNTGDFTVEVWANAPQGSTNGLATIFDLSNQFSSGFRMYMLNDGSVYVQCFGGFSDVVVGTSPPISFNAWHHIAFVRSGMNFYLFLDGIKTDLDAIYAGSGGTAGDFLWVGASYNSNIQSTWFNGYLDEMRITKGIARYTANFLPPTGPFSDPICPTGDDSFLSVSLLLHMNGANGGTTFTDSSTYAHTISVAGTPVTSTAVPKFGTAALKSLGGTNSNYVSTPIVAAGELDLSTGDFTIEYWLYALSFSGVNNGIFSTSTAPGTSGIFMEANGVGSLVIEFWNGVGYSSLAAYAHMSLNVWYHIALVRSGSNFTEYVNGVATGAPTTYAGSIGTGTTLKIAALDSSLGGIPAWNGYIDDFRITKGVARYTTDFLLLYCPFPDTTPGIAGGTIYGKFVDALAFAPIQSTNLGVAKPRVWQPLDFYTTKVPK